ncbi:hypothetical protein HAX54_045738 [Datura stramonium]|uniref:Uncharacterized protein n=1 Tax=Datura stramonium TaxID=4076 RepID=A0ABS8WI66_DATST|nr:hypothetical protein [Datura stramonium]
MGWKQCWKSLSQKKCLLLLSSQTRQNMKYHTDNKSAASVFGSRNAEIQLLLGVVGAPLIPHPIRSQHSLNTKINDHPIVLLFNNFSVSILLRLQWLKYIVQQYIAAAGGEHALNSIDSMYAMGKIKMVASEFTAGDGKVAWRQTPWHHSHASRGPARPLRRSLQGLDPKSVANLFSTSICIGEKTVNEEDCFVYENSEGHTRTRMEEVWSIEEVDFNIKGLSADCFLPPSDLKKEDEVSHDVNKKSRLGFKTPKLRTARRGASKIMAIDEEDLEDYEADEES